MFEIRILYFLFLFVSLNSIAATSEEVAKTTEILRSLCLAGSAYTIEADGDGSLKILKKSVNGSIKFSKKELNGVVDVSDEDRRDELDSIRNCIKPHIKKIIEASLSTDKKILKDENENKKILKDKKDIDNFLYEDFASIEEGLVPEKWILGENFIVEIKNGKHVLISNPIQKNNKITIPNIKFSDDFIISINAKIQHDGEIVIKLSNNTFVFDAYQGRTMRYKINKAEKEIKETFVKQRAVFTIRKEGSVFKLYVNGIRKMVSRIAGFEKPEALEINFNDDSYGFEMYGVEGKKYTP